MHKLSRDDLVSLEGSVVATTGGGNYQIKLENGTIILARLSGKIKRFKIKILVGDKVTVAVSPYDPTHGFITHRQRLNT